MTETARCPYCGHEFDPGQAVCPNCGQPATPAAAPGAWPYPPPPYPGQPYPPPYPGQPYPPPPYPGQPYAPPPYQGSPYGAPPNWAAPSTQFPPGHPSAPRESGYSGPAAGILIGGIMVAVGCLLPWFTLSFYGMSMLSVSGVEDGRDGILILPLGVILAVLGGIRLSKVGLGNIKPAALIIGAIAVVAAILEVLSLGDLTELESEYMSVDVGIGLYLIGIGGLVAGLSALMSRS
jgi:hypothetical protein